MCLVNKKSIQSSILILVFVISIVHKGFNQSYNISYIGIEQGLPERFISNIIQDDNGFMWFVPFQNGIIRYDGVHFERYSIARNRGIQLYDNTISSIIKTNSGQLWAANDGITIINPKTMISRQVLEGKAVFGLTTNKKNIIRCLFKEKNGTIWGVDYRGVFTIQNEDVKTIQTVAGLPKESNCYYINKDNTGTLWFFTYAGIYYLDKQGHFICAKTNLDTRFSEKPFLVITDTENDLVGVIHLNTHFTLNEKEKTFYKGFPNNTISWQFFKKNYASYKEYVGNFVQAQDEYVNQFCFYKSKDATIWVGSHYGIFKIRPKITQFKTCPDLVSCSIRGLFEDTIKNTIFVGSYKGLFEYSPKTNTAHRISGEMPFHLLYKKENQLLVLSEGRGLQWIDLKQPDKASRVISPKGYSFSMASYTDSGNRVWFAHLGQIYTYDIHKDHREKFKFKNNKIDTLNGIITAIQKTKDGLFWVATTERLFCFDEKEGYKEYSFFQDARLGANSSINCIYEDEKGVLWLASKNFGLISLNRKDGTLVSYTHEDGLPNNETYAILSNDGGKNLYISTAHGLSFFDTEKKIFKNYYQNLGIAHNEFNRASYLKASDGAFYFGGINGITHFFPTKMDSQTNLIRPILTDYSIFSTKDSVKKFTQLGGLPTSIYMSPNDNIIEFHLSSTDYFEPQKVVYAYKMSDIDNDWVYLGSNNQIRYMNLAAGDYKLYVKVASSSGVWSNDILEISVHKELEFYQKAWFWVLIAIFVGLLVWSGFQIRLLQIRKENEIRMSIAANIHDDLGGTLYSINSSARKLKANLTDVEELSEVNQLVQFCEEAYQNMGELIWAINPENQYVYSLLERMEDYKDSILQSYTKITTFNMGDFETQKKISVDTKQHILMIFKESLVNIRKHSKPNKITIEIFNMPVFSLKVTNCFDERTQTDFSSGKGLYSMKQRAEQLNGTIKIESEKDCYTIYLLLKKPI